MNYWAVPFYNTKEGKVSVIVWNNKDDSPIDVSFIINNKDIINIDQVKKFEWRMSIVGDIEDISSIMILVNHKIKTNIILNDETKEVFKKTNYSQHT
jgi:hypothetical protein